VTVDGDVLFHSPRDYWSIPQFVAGPYEPEVADLISRLLMRGMTFVDVGANIGYFTLVGARRVGDTGHVYAFEPDPTSYDFLRKNVQANGYTDFVTTVQAAVSDRSGEAEFFLGVEGRGTSTFYRRASVGRQTITVATISLDMFFKERGWPPVDVVKLDIEGNEKLALAGLAEASQRNRDLRLIVEFSLLTMTSAGVTPEDLIESIRSVGFNRVSIIGNALDRITSPKDFAMLSRKSRFEPVNLLCEKGI
jgi:FkbM family methyltransferase